MTPEITIRPEPEPETHTICRRCWDMPDIPIAKPICPDCRMEIIANLYPGPDTMRRHLTATRPGYQPENPPPRDFGAGWVDGYLRGYQEAYEFVVQVMAGEVLAMTGHDYADHMAVHEVMRIILSGVGIAEPDDAVLPSERELPEPPVTATAPLA